jgi:preprotein translocase subunit SecA
MISKSIESAQKKVEGNNFDIRKHLVEYDDVINKHRTAIYKRRREILEIAEGVRNNEEAEPARELADIILEMIKEEITLVANFHVAGDNLAEWNLKEIYETIKTIWPADESLLKKLEELTKSGQSRDKIREEIISFLISAAQDKYLKLREEFSKTNLNFKEVEKGILIRSIDENWVEHLETVDYLRRGIGLRGYGQRDPLVEYKKEAWHLYQELNGLINKNVVYSIFKTGDALMMSASQEIKRFASEPTTKLEFTGAQKEMQRQAEARNTLDLVREKVRDESGQKVGRNDPCPCGSGKKFKQCHGK